MLYGDSYAIPVPDLDRTDHLIIFGGNPLVSNGSIMSAPNMKARLQRIQERGGRVVVVDPRRTETAAVADEHVFVRPGTDLWMLAAMVRHVLATGAVDQPFVDQWADGVEAVGRMVEPFSFDAVATRCGVAASTVRRLAEDLVAAPRTAVYGRMGTSTQRFGSACSWLIACLNVLTGNVDRPGGVMFPLSASVYRPPRTPASEHRDRWHSRVRGLGELLGELPAITLAEDILTPGPGRIRGLVTVAGNPAVSVPGSVAMREALAELELMISIDSYVNETTRHADVILPGESPFERPHFPFLTRFAVRNVVQWSDPVLPPEGDRPREWEALLRVAAAFEQRTDVDVASVDDAAFAGRVAAEVRDPRSPVHGRDPDEIVRLAGAARGPERLIDFRFRVGPYGDGYGADPDGLSIEKLRRHPHGIDLGPLQPRLADVVATRSGRIELAHPELAAELDRALAEPPPSAGSLLLVSRRSLRSNNSWMHNIPKLVSGRPRCTLLIHPDDAAARGVTDGDVVQVRSATGAVRVPVEVTADIMAGVVNLPHGWGHDLPGMRMAVAAASPGVNSNLLGDGTLVDGLTNTAVTNGIPVTVEPSAAPGAVDAGTPVGLLMSERSSA